MKKTTGEPVYQGIYKELRNQIVKGELKPGSILPSENELAARYETTRMTVRKSLQVLEHSGFIYSWPGKGYYVSEPKHHTFTLEFQEDESAEQSSFREITMIRAGKEIGTLLGIGASARVWKIVRVIYQDGEAIAYDMKYIPYQKGMPTLEKEINYAIFPDIVSNQLPPFAFHTKMEIGLEALSEEAALAMKCSTQEPVMVLYRYFLDDKERCIGYGKKYLRKSYGRLKAQSGYLL